MYDDVCELLLLRGADGVIGPIDGVVLVAHKRDAATARASGGGAEGEGGGGRGCTDGNVAASATGSRTATAGSSTCGTNARGIGNGAGIRSARWPAGRVTVVGRRGC